MFELKLRILFQKLLLFVSDVSDKKDIDFLKKRQEMIAYLAERQNEIGKYVRDFFYETFELVLRGEKISPQKIPAPMKALHRSGSVINQPYLNKKNRQKAQMPSAEIYPHPKALFYFVGLKLTVRMISPNTPAAVTPAPAPYPRTVSGIGV